MREQDASLGTVRVGILPDQSEEFLRERYAPLLGFLSNETGAFVELVVPRDYEELALTTNTQGRKVFTLQTLPFKEDTEQYSQAGKVAGFARHAGVAAETHQRDKLERVCRYISRPAVSE